MVPRRDGYRTRRPDSTFVVYGAAGDAWTEAGVAQITCADLSRRPSREARRELSYGELHANARLLPSRFVGSQDDVQLEVGDLLAQAGDQLARSRVGILRRLGARGLDVE